MVAYSRREHLRRRMCAFLLPLIALAFNVAQAEDLYTPRKMTPTPPEELADIGTARGMSLYPSSPVPGFPGMDPDVPGREPRNTPMYLPYEGSVELYSRGAGYHPKVLPYNHRTLIRNFIATQLPGVAGKAKESFSQREIWLKPGAGWWCDYVPTGNQFPPVKVVRLTPGGPRLKLEFGPLDTSMYVLRVIGAIDSKNVVPYPKDLIIECRINDGPQGKVNRYILRGRGMDAFFDVADFFFHVVDARPFKVEIGLHPDSAIDLLVPNIDLHDVLGECARRAGKTDSLQAPLRTLKANWKDDPEQKLKQAKAGEWAAVFNKNTIERHVAELKAEFPDKNEAELLKIWRQRRDDRIWNAGAPLNVNLMGDEWGGLPITLPANFSKVDPETAKMMVAKGLLPEDYEGKVGRVWKKLPLGYIVPRDLGPWRIIDAKTKETVYTLDDLKQYKPYPGLPWEVRPWGKRFQSDLPGNAKHGTESFKQAFFLAPQTQAIGMGIKGPNIYWSSYVRSGDMQSGRDMAIKLVRWAYHLPNLAPGRYLSRVCAPSVRAHLRWTRFYQYLDDQYIDAYDKLFTLIRGNQELADAVGRYIPWVETPEDVITLLDTYQVQYLARQMAYWRQNWYGHGNSGRMAKVAAIQMDPAITTPWVNLIFTATFEYPFPLAGIQDLMYMAIQRDGTTNIGSSYYTFAGSLKAAQWLKTYIRNGGDPKYDLTDPRRYPRVTAGLYWIIEGWVAGMQHMAIGDVGGFYRCQGEWIPNKVRVMSAVNSAWQWTDDPRFAWLTSRFGRRGDETADEWAALVKAADATRNPYMANDSRVMVNWAGILEGGRQADDFRLRHAARVRVGYGTGHAHADGLDFAMWSLGVPLNINAGGRGGYGYPSTTSTVSHNTVTVDRKGWNGHSWIQQLSPMGNCQYLSARGVHREEYSRRVALIELDKGVASAEAPSDDKSRPAQYGRGRGTKFGKDVTFPRAYAFDVFRARGGREHIYNFHGFPDDAFELNVKPATLSDTEQEFIKQYTLEEQGAHWGGTLTDNDLVATWMLNREVKEFTCSARPQRKYIAHQPNHSKVKAGAEQFMMGSAYDPESPRKFLRVRVLGQKGARVITGKAIIAPYGVGRTDGEFHRQVHVIRDAGDGVAENLFVALWEPYAGKPVVKAAQLEGDTRDDGSFAAVSIETVDGIHDLCYVDGPASRERTLKDGTRVEADFAYVSRDAKGLRQASITAGRVLDINEAVFRPEATRYEARIIDVDYFGKVATLDRALPAGALDGAFFEVGCPARGIHQERWTTFEAVSVKPTNDGRTMLQWRKGADVFSGNVLEVPKKKDYYAWQSNVIKTSLAAPVKYGEHAQLVLTADGKEDVWRCDAEIRGNYKGSNAKNGALTLYGAPFHKEITGDTGKPVRVPIFEPGDRVYLWAFGKGDIWRTPTRLWIERTDTGDYAVKGNVACAISPKSAAQWSADGKTWQAVPADGLLLDVAQVGSGNIRLRLTQGK